MELKKGYKKTDIGIIPEDWLIAKISDCAIVEGGYAFKSNHYIADGDYQIIKMSNLYQDTLDLLRSKSFLNKIDNSQEHYLLKENEILITLTGTVGKRDYGYTYRIRNEKNLLLNQRVARIISNQKNNPVYLDFILKHTCFLNQFFDISRGGTGNQANVGTKDVEVIRIPAPSFEEQTAIAKALSDADALISSLEKLIEKKRNIKQGAMQQLLKPKKGWVEMTILQLADNKKELFDDGDWIESEHITTEGIRLIQTGNIGLGNYVEKETKKYINEASFKSIRCKELRIGDLLICRLAEPAGRACILPDIGEYKVVTSVDVTIFRPREELVNRIFLVNIFSTNEWLEAISGMSGGTTHKRISRGALGRTKIFIPSIEEQNRIAEILNDMDNEITSLEKKLTKTKMLKQGMMQELLTGKTRLV